MKVFEALILATSVSMLIVSLLSAILAIKDKREDHSKKSVRDEFLEVIVKSYSANLLKDMTDIRNIYIKYYDSGGKTIGNKDLLGHLLRELLVNLVKGKYDGEIDDKREFKKIITAMIEENEIENPFEELPKLEKALHDDLKVFIEMNKTTESLSKLNELASLAVSKQLLVVKLNKQARWNIPLAIFGLVLSIFFGIQSFVK